MGCAPSMMRGIRVTHKEDKTSVEEFAQHKPLPYQIGAGIPTRPNSQKLVIFIFGGPQSQKGFATHELITQYDFHSINVEEIVLGYLPSRFKNTSPDQELNTASDIQELLKKDTGALSLDWIFSVIMGKLAGSMHQRFVIDIIPALSSMLRADSYSSEDESKRALQDFERSYPVFCAFDFTTALLRPTTSDKKENEKPEKEKQNLSSEMKTFLKGIDEADKGRLEKRMDAYSKCAAPFISYFAKSKRLVKIDVSSIPAAEPLTATILDVMHELRFTRSLQHNRVILFVTGESVFEHIDLAYYNMKRIRMTDVLSGKKDNESLASQIRGLKAYIERVSIPKENYAIIADALHHEAVSSTKRTTFVMQTRGFIDEYLVPSRNAPKPTVRQRLGMHAIAASPDETLLFVDPFPARLASKVGLIWSERPTSRATITPSPTGMH
ncbi:hypothetical protein PENTCL1PPCAC_19502 [Pristionchus entomophagus]|uniref:Adenylate kinase n=1 Tax=Pristionchus entomophagus TaxID=358040 RepID=A0AAV5TSX6_9BILA|nr:hypothetical protein PENTCL1PPCAC_19502 [Pristionchus entomophagus]